MQHKNNFLFTLFLFIFINTCFSNGNIKIKNEADSLFNLKEYTKAQELYESLFNEKQVESDDLLLKLALINEGLGDVPKAIYYLKEFSKKNPTLEIEEHIEELANNNQLIGYEITDFSKLYLFLLKHKLTIVLINFSVSIMLFVLIFYVIFIKKKKPIALLIAFVVFIQLSLFSIYLIENKRKGIIQKESLLMDKPSAGSKLQKKIEKGHQVIILDDFDIWYKIELNDKFYYIRKSNLMVI